MVFDERGGGEDDMLVIWGEDVDEVEVGVGVEIGVSVGVGVWW